MEFLLLAKGVVRNISHIAYKNAVSYVFHLELFMRIFLNDQENQRTEIFSHSEKMGAKPKKKTKKRKDDEIELDTLTLEVNTIVYADTKVEFTDRSTTLVGKHEEVREMKEMRTRESDVRL